MLVALPTPPPFPFVPVLMTSSPCAACSHLKKHEESEGGGIYTKSPVVMSLPALMLMILSCCVSQVTRHTSHVTRHTSHVTRHVTHDASSDTCHTSSIYQHSSPKALHRSPYPFPNHRLYPSHRRPARFHLLLLQQQQRRMLQRQHRQLLGGVKAS